DRVILELLKPHLVNSLRITEALKQLVAQRDYLSRYARTGVVVFDFEGKVRFTSPVVDEWVKAYFELKPSEEIPTELASFAQAQIRSVTGPEYYLPPGTIAFRSMDRELIVRAIVDFEKRELTLLLNEKRERKSADFVALGFTPREADVLIWMAKGFSDEAIAIMCGIGPRTVQKHVEHIRHKLNVESRTAAVLTVLELLEHRP
ncbi:MAG TPA: LuxR C-terminal-related transcriptional regulator, partial [Pyrinomonadaceae bacterium]